MDCASHRVTFNSNVMIQQQGCKVQEEVHAYFHLHTHKHVLVPRVTLSLFCLCMYLQVHTYSRLQRVDEWLHSRKKAPGETFQLLQSTQTYRELQSFRALVFHHTECSENLVAYGCACVQHGSWRAWGIIKNYSQRRSRFFEGWVTPWRCTCVLCKRCEPRTLRDNKVYQVWPAWKEPWQMEAGCLNLHTCAAILWD